MNAKMPDRITLAREATTVPMRRRVKAALALSCALVGAANTGPAAVEAFALAPSVSVPPRNKVMSPALLRAAVGYGVQVESESTSSEQFSDYHHAAPPQQQQQCDDGDDGYPKRARSLYDVLRSSPDATREELKAQYVALARETHPDATLGRRSDETDGNRPDFNEVATAWKVLCDKRERLQYDRSLKAERFTEDVGNVASHVFDVVAAPLLRRRRAVAEATTTATTHFEAAARSATMHREEEVVTAAPPTTTVDLDQALSYEFQSSQAGQAVDRMELLNDRREREETATHFEEGFEPGTSPEAYEFNTMPIASDVESLALLRETLNEEIAMLEEAERQIRALKLQIPQHELQFA